MKILEQVEQSTLQMVPNYGGKLTKLGFITCARISHQFDDNV